MPAKAVVILACMPSVELVPSIEAIKALPKLVDVRSPPIESRECPSCKRAMLYGITYGGIVYYNCTCGKTLKTIE